jgi:hypothetical protein
MSQQEHVFFDNGSVRVSDVSLALHKGGVYPIANLAQVTYARIASKRLWTGILVFFGILSLIVAWLSSGFTSIGGTSALENALPYEMIGGSLLLLAVVRTVFQIILPVYVVLLKGPFGSAQPIRSRNRRDVEKVVIAVQQAMHQAANRGTNTPPIFIQNTLSNTNTPIYNNNLISGSLNNASDIAVGHQAQVTRLPQQDDQSGQGF